jgi:hypothetical protein
VRERETGDGKILYADRIEPNPLIDRGHSGHIWQYCASNRDTDETHGNAIILRYETVVPGLRGRKEIMKPYRDISRSVIDTIKATSYQHLKL